MDAKRKESRYSKWVEILSNCQNSGLNKREYCEQNGINYDALLYYQRCIRKLSATQIPQSTLPNINLCSEVEMASNADEETSIQPDIVKLQIHEKVEEQCEAMRFNLNGMDFTVSEDIPTPFLAKLLEAATHGAR